MTIFELIITLGLVSILAALGVETYLGALLRARNTRALADIRSLERMILNYNQTEGKWPSSLLDLQRGQFFDPWGNPYRYLNLAEAAGPSGNITGVARKDRFLVPLNTDYDLYSMGPDGDSKKPLTAKASRDDILRAADGAFVGVAVDF